MSERTDFMKSWRVTNMEEWKVYINKDHYADYYFPEEENLEVLVSEAKEDVEKTGCRVSSLYIQPDTCKIFFYSSSSRSISDDDEGWWTL